MRGTLRDQMRLDASSLGRTASVVRDGGHVLNHVDLETYHQQTEPLKAFYEKAGKLVIVQGQGEVSDTSRLVLAALEA